MAVPGPAVGPLTYASPSNTTGIQVPCPPDVGAGDIIMVAFEKELSATVTPADGAFAEATGGTATTTGHVQQLHAFVKRASAADTGTYDFSWTGTAPYAEGAAIRIPNALASGTPFEATQGAQRSTSAAATPNVALTTLGADRLLVWIGANFNGGTWTPPAAPATFTELFDAGFCLTIAVLDRPTAGATGNVAGTCSASEYSTARMLAILPAVAGANRGIPIGVFL